MSDQKAPPPEGLPEPAREALDEPHLSAADLEREIGESDSWGEASEDASDAKGGG